MNRERTVSITPRTLALDGMFTALLILLGMIKLPSILPGAEFQLSAPYAVCLVAGVGFWRYLGIGVCASLVQLMMGTHTPWNVLVAMVFRVAAGLIVSLLPGKKWAMVLAGPVGTGCARVVLAGVLGALWCAGYVLVSGETFSVFKLAATAAAVPGVGFTGVCVALLEPVLRRIPGMERCAREE